MDKTDTYFQANRARALPGTDGSMPERRYAANCQFYAAYPASAVHLNNRANEIQDSCRGIRIWARCRRVSRAWRVSSREAETSPGRAIRIKSSPEVILGISVRMASRKRRLARFR